MHCENEKVVHPAGGRPEVTDIKDSAPPAGLNLKTKTNMKKHFITLTAFCLLFCAMVAAICLTSCNVTRTVTTSSQYSQRGDTTTTITTKTVESYNAVKK